MNTITRTIANRMGDERADSRGAIQQDCAENSDDADPNVTSARD